MRNATSRILKKSVQSNMLIIWALFLLSFVLRVIFIFQDAISFHYDMSRDAFIAEQIWKNFDFKILGPPTSTPGLFHGVLYYYLITPFYLIGQGDPRVASIFMSTINSLAVMPIYFLTKDIFKNSSLGLLAGFLYAISFEAIQYAPWLSNPSPAMLTIAMFFCSLRLWQKQNKWGLPLLVLFAGLSVQFQFFLIYLFGVILVFKIIFKVRVTFTQILISGGVGLLTLSTFIIAIVKFHTFGQVLNGLSGISTYSQFNFRTQFTDLFLNYLNRFADIFINNFLPSNIFLGGILGLVILYFCRQNKFVFFLLVSNLLIFMFGGHNSVFVNVGMITPAILGLMILLQKIWRQNKIAALILVGLIIFSNLLTIFKIAPKGQLALVIPKDMVLSYQLKLIDKTYEIAKGQPFSINSLTLPLWTNTTWAYLYHWYGRQNYGYTPSFYGRDQVGLPGEDALPKISKPMDISFFILEPPEGIPSNFYQSEINSENGHTNLEEEIDYGTIKLQLRKPIKYE